MLRTCVSQIRGSLDTYLYLIKFAYNNSYHSSIEMMPFETWYDINVELQLLR